MRVPDGDDYLELMLYSTPQNAEQMGGKCGVSWRGRPMLLVIDPVRPATGADFVLTYRAESRRFFCGESRMKVRPDDDFASTDLT